MSSPDGGKIATLRKNTFLICSSALRTVAVDATILGFIFFPIITSAQQVFEGGLMAGITGSQIDGDGMGGYHKIGVSADIYAKLVFNKKWGMISGVGYAGKGAMSDIKYQYLVTSFHYAEIPIWFEYNALDKFSFTGGLTVGYLIRGYQKTSGITFDEKDLKLLKMEYSTYFSVNYKLSDRLSLNLVHTYSILPINEYSNIFTKNFIIYLIQYGHQPHPLWYNRSIRLSIQYKIFKSKRQSSR